MNGAPLIAGLRKASTAIHGFAEGIAGKLKSAITSPIAGIGAALAGVLSVGAFAAGIKGALDLGGSMEDLKNQTGETAGNLMLLQQVLKDNGIEAEETGGIINKMQASLATAGEKGSKTAKALKDIGLSFREIQDLSPVEQFRAIGRAINGLADPIEKVDAARAFFGKQGGKFMGALGDTQGFETAARALGKQAQLLSENSAAFDQISDRLARAGLKLQGFFVGVTSQLVPALDRLSSILDETDFAEQGERFGAGIKEGAAYLAGIYAEPEQRLSAFKNYFKAMAAEWGNLMYDAIFKAGNALKATLAALGDWWTGIGGGDLMENLPKKLSGIYDMPAKDYFGAGNFYNAAVEASNALRNAGKYLNESIPKEENSTPVNFSTLGKGGLLDTKNPGLRGASMQIGQEKWWDFMSFGGRPGIQASQMSSAYGGPLTGGNLLTARQRRAMIDAGVAAGDFSRPSSSAGAYGAVRRGDHARQLAAIREKAMKLVGIEKVNATLDESLKEQKRTNSTLESYNR